MAIPQTIEAMRHPFTTGSDIKRMLISGQWVRAASGKTFESRNPATGDLLTTVAEGDKEEIAMIYSSEYSDLDKIHGE